MAARARLGEVGEVDTSLEHVTVEPGENIIHLERPGRPGAPALARLGLGFRAWPRRTAATFFLRCRGIAIASELSSDPRRTATRDRMDSGFCLLAAIQN